MSITLIMAKFENIEIELFHLTSIKNPYINCNLQVVMNLLSAKNDQSGLMPKESPAELIASEKMDEVAEVVEVGQGRTRPVHNLESVIDKMACKESCMHNPHQEVRPSLAMISEQWVGTPTVNPVDSRPAVLQEFKTYVDAETQTEPFVCSPVEILIPRIKRKLVEKDHTYRKENYNCNLHSLNPASCQKQTLRMTLCENPTAPMMNRMLILTMLLLTMIQTLPMRTGYLTKMK